MRKTWITGVSATVLLASIASGCGTSTTGGASSASSSPSAKDAGTAKTTAAPAGKGKLTLYSPNAAEINNPIIKEFQDRTGIEVQLITGGTGDLLKRVQAETQNPLGDVFWAGGADSLEAYKQFFEPYTTKEIDNILPAYVDVTNVWTPFNALPMVITYNKELVSENDLPKSWKDLLDPKWKGKIAYADPAKSGSSYTQLITMLTAFGRDDGKGWEYVKKLNANLDGKLLSSSSLVQRGVPDKEFALGITLEDAAIRYIEGGSKIGVLYPSEGTSAVPDAAAIIKGSKNLSQAKQFIDFLVSKDVQELIQKEFKRRSVRKDVAPVEGLPQTKDIKLVNYDFIWSAANKNEVIKRFSKITTGQE
ncbi:ABC transporter substrate-binding protein [Paenibacillus sp. HWE-109]|uniref:ABC transporter substrate-binding protein n=1 Tax=Paenibacillus sp. HWE-109 TaxID=1306526 RepID=UPI001EDF8BE8|nr:ABC transporter substrate-binding protein [Paenibacillus sp. HWE-109]UKS30886.1 ABC transporter substrate-binding protein [Paenibacillus sp. HWE-109]